MGWFRVTGDDDDLLSDHEGWPAAQLATPLPAEVLDNYPGVLHPGQTETSMWAADIGPYITGWRAACECGWRGSHVYPRAEYPTDDGGYPEEVEQACQAEWDAHIDQLMPEEQIREAARAAGGAQERLAVAVRDARAGGVSWDAIGRATGTSRQAAWERWRHLDVQLAAAAARANTPAR